MVDYRFRAQHEIRERAHDEHREDQTQNVSELNVQTTDIHHICFEHLRIRHSIDPVSSNYIDLDIDLHDIALRFDLIAQDSDSEWLSMRACFLASIDALLKDIYMKEQERIIEAAFSRVIKKYELEDMDNLSECHMNEAFSEISDEVYRLIRSVR